MEILRVVRRANGDFTGSVLCMPGTGACSIEAGIPLRRLETDFPIAPRVRLSNPSSRPHLFMVLLRRLPETNFSFGSGNKLQLAPVQPGPRSKAARRAPAHRHAGPGRRYVTAAAGGSESGGGWLRAGPAGWGQPQKGEGAKGAAAAQGSGSEPCPPLPG